MDGTHIGAHVPEDERIIYTNRKGKVTQNVLAICDFNYRFTFMMVGTDGQSHDENMLAMVLGDPMYNFPSPPLGKYYLVDSGFANNEGFLAPYKGERYHGSEYRMGGPPRSRKELFNHIHSSLRNIIERTFGIWKNRFRVLQNMPPYKLSKQIKIVIATAAIHNFIVENDINDSYIRSGLAQEGASESDNNDDVDEEEGSNALELSNTLWMNGVRDSISFALATYRRGC